MMFTYIYIIYPISNHHINFASIRKPLLGHMNGSSAPC